jgi:hypothetical protein
VEIHTTTCPGCGLSLYSPTNGLATDYNASIACVELLHKLSYYTLELRDPEFIHQLIVDTYMAQHFGQKVKPMGITFALVGLYLVNEKGYTGKMVQDVHVRLANANLSKSWPYFPQPTKKSSITVKTVLESPDKKKAIKDWSESVWDIWKDQKGSIAELLGNFHRVI